MKSHTVQTESFVHHFKEVDNMDEIEMYGFDISNAMQVWGPAPSLTEFVHKMEIEERWLPYGYGLRFILIRKGTTTVTAFLFKNPAQ